MTEVEPKQGRRGDGHTVLMLPGFSAGDWSNAPLAAVVRRNGARPKRWRLGSNEGPTERVVAGLDARLRELYYREERTVTVVGVSLGGVFARQLARSVPHMIRQVITIGSPFRFSGDGKSATVQQMWERRLDDFVPEVLTEMYGDEDDKPPLTMPATSIYSRLDDVVRWPQCLNPERPRCENIEVRGATHIGLLLHPGVHLALANRVRQRNEHWKPFRPPVAARAMFRVAPYFEADRA